MPSMISSGYSILTGRARKPSRGASTDDSSNVLKTCVYPRLGRPTRRRNRFRLSVTDIQYVIDYEPGADLIRIMRIQSTREIV